MKKNKPVIITGIILTVLLILVFTITLLVGNYLESELQNRQIGIYNIQSREVNVNLLLRRVTINEAVAEDTTAGHKFTIPQIRATGIRIFPFILSNKLVINNLRIQNPVISFMQEKPDKNRQTEEKDEADSEREIELIRIKQMQIADAVFSVHKQTNRQADTLLWLNAGLELWNLNIFSNREQLIFMDHSVEKVRMKANKIRYNIPGGLYRLHVGSFKYSSDEQGLSLEDLHLSSLHSKYDIAQQTGVETDWYDIGLKHFEMKGIDQDALLNDSAFVFRTAVLDELHATIFRDKRPPFPDKPDTKLPMDMLKSLPVALHSDSILIKNATVVYEEHAEESTEPGNVTFNRLFATIYNLGTLPGSIGGPTAMSARAYVMNESLLNVEFVFPNNQYSHHYKVSGSLHPVELSAFNPMLVPAAFVRVEQGRIRGLEFDFSYNENRSEGNLSLEYENLDISLLDKEDGSQKKIKTFIAETFVLNKDNLKEDNSYREGSISAEREKKKSIFNYWWKSLFSGIKDVLAF